MTFKYYEPTEIEPQHTPDKVKNPGKWKYYDVDLDAVRENLATNVYLGGAKDLTREQYQEKEEVLDVLNQWIARKRDKRPEVGQYDPERPEKHVAEFDFGKVQGRERLGEEDLLDE